MPGAFEHIEERLPVSERRTCSRQPVRALAYVELDEGNGGIVLNASEGGLSVQAVMSLMEDSLPKMRFQLSQSKDWLETSARVVWANESRKVAGLQFVDLPEQARLHIRQWLAGEAVGVEPDERREPAIAQDHADDQADDHAHDHDNGAGAIGEEPAATRATTAPAVGPTPVPPPAPAMHVFGQLSAFEAETHPLASGPLTANSSERAWNIAGLLAVLAIVSLAAGWIAGRGTLDSLWEKLRETTPPAKTDQPDLPPVSAGASGPIQEIEIVDIHNQRWTIPFSPTASANQPSPRAQAQSTEWPSFNPAATAPEIRSPVVADGANSQQPNPPVVAAPSDNAASIPLASQSPDPRDLAPPAPKAEPQATQPASVLQHGALIYHVDPVYPELAREQDIQGTVKLEVTIGETGAVRSVIAVSGPGLLIEAARSAVRQWRYTPSLLNGKPIESQEYVSIVFQLPSTSK
jgi:TonB family protein